MYACGSLGVLARAPGMPQARINDAPLQGCLGCRRLISNWAIQYNIALGGLRPRRPPLLSLRQL
eukprot:13794820-Heterocapsa_arctica.AAC.1